MEPQVFWKTLQERDLTFFSGVPDSTLSALHNAMLNNSAISYVPAVREDVALGLASAAYFGGRIGGIMMQNSGIGNIVNPLTSFSLIYRIPVLLVVGWRGYGGPTNDAPEHWIMGTKTTKVLELLEVPYEVLEPEGVELALDRLLGTMIEFSVPGALLVREGVIQ